MYLKIQFESFTSFVHWKLKLNFIQIFMNALNNSQHSFMLFLIMIFCFGFHTSRQILNIVWIFGRESEIYHFDLSSVFAKKFYAVRGNMQKKMIFNSLKSTMSVIFNFDEMTDHFYLIFQENSLNFEPISDCMFYWVMSWCIFKCIETRIIGN